MMYFVRKLTSKQIEYKSITTHERRSATLRRLSAWLTMVTRKSVWSGARSLVAVPPKYVCGRYSLRVTST